MLHFSLLQLRPYLVSACPVVETYIVLPRRFAAMQVSTIFPAAGLLMIIATKENLIKLLRNAIKLSILKRNSIWRISTAGLYTVNKGGLLR